MAKLTLTRSLVGIATLGLSVSLVAWAVRSANQPLVLGVGPQLFIDDHLVLESNNLRLDLHQPRRLDHPVIVREDPWHQQPLFFLKVQFDSSRSRAPFRMWYALKNDGYAPAIAAIAYAESENGIDWNRPNLGIVELEGSTRNNLILRFTEAYELGLILVDGGANYRPPDQRFKMITELQGKMRVRVSRDGLHFRETHLLRLPRMGDILDGGWDPLRGRFLAMFKVMSSPDHGYKGSTSNAEEGARRLVGMSTSKDLKRWTDPQLIVEAEPSEAGIWEFYGMVPRVRGDLYLGFLRVLRDDLPAEPGGPVQGIGWTELCTSRDGEEWTRYRDRPFLDRNRKSGTWDRAMSWFGDIVTVGSEEYVYYGGYDKGHKYGDRQIGLARMRKNGFASRFAGVDGGRLLTPLFWHVGSGITVNADVSGNLKVRVLDESGQPIEGFDFDDMSAITTDSVAHPVRWIGDWRSSSGRAIQLEFSMHDARLFGFDLLETR